MSTRESPGSPTLGAEALLLLTVVIWGVNFSVVKFALATIPPLAFNGLRFFVAAVILLLLARVTGTRLAFERRHLPWLVALGLLGNAIYQCLFIYGAAATSADNAALILATVPAWVVVLGAISGLDRVSGRGWAGAGLALSGIVVIVLGADHEATFAFGGASLKGDALVLLGTLCWASYTLLARLAVERYPPLAVTTFCTVVGALPLVAVGLPQLRTLELEAVPVAAWASTVFSGAFAIALAYVLWNRSVAHLGSARTALASNLTPVFAFLTAWLWLGETLTVQQGFGALLVVAGVALTRRGSAKTAGASRS